MLCRLWMTVSIILVMKTDAEWPMLMQDFEIFVFVHTVFSPVQTEQKILSSPELLLRNGNKTTSAWCQQVDTFRRSGPPQLHAVRISGSRWYFSFNWVTETKNTFNATSLVSWICLWIFVVVPWIYLTSKSLKTSAVICSQIIKMVINLICSSKLIVHYSLCTYHTFEFLPLNRDNQFLIIKPLKFAETKLNKFSLNTRYISNGPALQSACSKGQVLICIEKGRLHRKKKKVAV